MAVIKSVVEEPAVRATVTTTVVTTVDPSFEVTTTTTTSVALTAAPAAAAPVAARSEAAAAAALAEQDCAGDGTGASTAEPSSEQVYYTNGNAKSKSGKFHTKKYCPGLLARRTPLIQKDRGYASLTLRLEACKLCVL